MTAIWIFCALLLGFFGVVLLSRGRPVPKVETLNGVVSPEEMVAPVGKDGFYHTKRYDSRKKLLTEAEVSLYGVLRMALPEAFVIIPKVRMADVIEPAQQHASDRQSALNKISSKHVDYLICRKENWEFCAAVELDDASHGKQARIERDEFVDKAFEQAQVPLVRFRARQGYSLESIRKEFRGLGLIEV